MTHKVVMLAVAAAMLAAPAYGAQARKKAEPPPPPPQFHVDVATRTMALVRGVSQVPTSAVIGKAAAGLFCVEHSQPIYTGNVFTPATPAELAQVFAQEAAAASYRVPTSQANMFDASDTSKAELAVGVALLDIKESGCVINPVIGFEATMEASLKVEWQVYDPLERKLLFRGTSEGAAKLRQSTDGTFAQMPAEVARRAFREATKTVLANPDFVAAVRDPKGGAPAQAGSLFPEAESAAPAAAAPLQIVRLPASTTPFKDQVTALRGQVVTVLTPGGSGSGFFIADGILLTNHHVIAGYSHVRLRFLGGREIDADVVSSNAKRDIALVKSTGVGVSGLPLRLEPPELAAQVFVIGSPLGERNEGSVLAGIVSAFRDEKDGSFIQSDVGVTHGNSGGPMFDDKGNVVALVDKGVDGTAVNRFIPIADALKVLDIRFAP